MKIVSVGIREAKINLSRLLKKVKQGQEVIITDRNKPVGKIIPISLDQLPLSERIKKMEDQGFLAPGQKGKSLPLPPPLPASKGVAQKYLQEDRES